MKYDKCDFCGNQVKVQKIRVDHRWKGKLIVVDDTPVGVCVNCGERYYNAQVMRQLDLIAKGNVGLIKQIKIPLTNFSRAIAV